MSFVWEPGGAAVTLKKDMRSSATCWIVYLVEVVAYKVDTEQVPIVRHQNKYFALNKEVS